MPVVINGGGLWPQVNKVLSGFDRDQKYQSADPSGEFVIARAIAELLHDPKKASLDRNLFPSHTMPLGPDPFLQQREACFTCTESDVLRFNTCLTLLSYEHFYPELGKPRCVHCKKSTSVSRDGWSRDVKRYFTQDSHRGIILSASYKCAKCPSK